MKCSKCNYHNDIETEFCQFCMCSLEPSRNQQMKYFLDEVYVCWKANDKQKLRFGQMISNLGLDDTELYYIQDSDLIQKLKINFLENE